MAGSGVRVRSRWLSLTLRQCFIPVAIIGALPVSNLSWGCGWWHAAVNRACEASSSAWQVPRRLTVGTVDLKRPLVGCVMLVRRSLDRLQQWTLVVLASESLLLMTCLLDEP